MKVHENAIAKIKEFNREYPNILDRVLKELEEADGLFDLTYFVISCLSEKELANGWNFLAIKEFLTQEKI